MFYYFRILVGLRWWSTIQENGKEEWHFESYGERTNANKTDSRIFWTSQYAFGLVWIIFLIVNFLSFNISNFTVCTVAAVLSVTNTMGYRKCDANHRKGISSYLFKKASNNLSVG